MFYVYVLKDPFTNDTFYVGKGKNDRMYVHEQKILRGENTHNNHLDNKIRKIHRLGGAVIAEKIYESVDEEQVLMEEISVIERVGLENLCNMQGGGDGRTPDKETRKKISDFHKGKPKTEEHKQKLREAKLGTKQSEETKQKKSEKLKGKLQTQKQKMANEKRSKALKGRKLSEEHKQKLREAKLKKPTKYWEGKALPEDMKKKISETVKQTLREKKVE